MLSLPRQVASTLLLSCICFATASHAEGDSKAVAEGLFQEGRRLMAAKKPAEACPKFAESQRVDPSSGTLLNLASCYEQTDRIATAWATYREALASAGAAGRADNVATAKTRSEALFPRLPYLVIKAPSPPPGLTLERDGATLALAVIDVPIPIDVGEHTVGATAPGKRPWSKRVVLEREGTTLVVEVPTLENAPTTTVEAPPTAAPPAPFVTQRRVGIALVGVGVIGVGVGAVFAATAKQKYDDSLTGCDAADKNLCNAGGKSRRDDARTAGNIATIAMAAGGAAIVGGVLVYVLGSSEKTTALTRYVPAVSSSGVTVGGSF